MWGVSAGAPVAVAAAPGAAAGAAAPAEAVEEKTIFTVTLKDVGPKKIDVIKAIRQVSPNLGLKEAKELAEAPDAKVLDQVSKEVAMDAKAKLEGAGAKVEVT
jgi:large subunit ribosomal protein L7/L12